MKKMYPDIVTRNSKATQKEKKEKLMLVLKLKT